jgi:hypothetical protein
MIGKKLSDGAIRGWVLGSAELPAKMSEGVKKAIQKAREAIGESRESFKAAFSELASAGMAAFDDVVGKQLTQTEKALADYRRRKEDEDSRGRIAEAEANLTKAQAGGDADAILNAQKELQNAQEAALVMHLERQAAAERQKKNERDALRRMDFEQQLTNLQNSLARQGATQQESHKRIMELFRKFGVDYRGSGLTLGKEFARGILDAESDVGRAAAQIAAAAAARLKLRSPAEEGPMSDLDKWWKPFAETLLTPLRPGLFSSGIDSALGTPAAGLAGRGSGTVQVTIVNPTFLTGDRNAARELAYQVEEFIGERKTVGGV